jgi:RNA polymerase sigma-70 factor (ECF subfamily)
MGIVEVERRTGADYELARGAAAGDAGAFEDLYRRYSRRVYSVCLRMTRNAHDAEDLTQEVFLHLLKKVGSFRGDSKFTTWLHSVTVSQVLMSLRRRKKRPEVSLEDESALQAVREAKNPTGLPLVDGVALKRAVARLPQGYRAVFGLYDVEGYDHAEVARILGVAEGTSKSQLHKARLKLRELLVPQAAQN